MSILFAPNNLPDNHEFSALSRVTTNGETLRPVLVSSSLQEALAQMILLDAPGTSYGVDRGEYYCQGSARCSGHCGLLNIENTRLRVDTRNFYKTRMKCAVPGCLAEYEYRDFADPHDLRPETERPGVLLARATNYPTAEPVGEAAIPYGQFGFFQEHRHFESATVHVIPRALKARLDSYIEFGEERRSPAQVANETLQGLQPIRGLVFEKLKSLASRALADARKLKREANLHGVAGDGSMEVEISEPLQPMPAQEPTPVAARLSI